MKHILIILLLVLSTVGNVFAFDWSIFATKSPSEEEVVRILGKPSKAGTLYDQVDYETFKKINKLDIYMLEYDESLNGNKKIFQSPLGVNATSILIWFGKSGSMVNLEGKVTKMFGIDFFFSGEDRDRAFTAFKFDKKCENKNDACFFTQQCWQVDISPSKDYKNFDEIYARKWVNGASYQFMCSKVEPVLTHCLDEEVRLTLHNDILLQDPKVVPRWKKECEESKKGAKQ